VSIATLATGYIAASYGLRPAPFHLGAAIAGTGLLLSLFFVRETHGHARHEARTHGGENARMSFPEIFGMTSSVGRKWMIAWGMWVQAGGIVMIAATASFAPWLVGAVLLGIGTAMVYPTLLAAIGDVAHPSWRASAVGVYRLWRDAGYAFGALLAGVISDLSGVTQAIGTIGALTFLSGLLVAARMSETLVRRKAQGGGG
jgi:MFS family permease